MKIKIDRDSIKKNPDAGRTEYLIEGYPREMRVEFWIWEQIDPEETFGLKNAFITTLQVRASSSTGILVSTRFEDLEILKAVEGFKILSVDYYIPTRTMWSMTPEPEFLFEYENTNITCYLCRESFSWRDLDSDYHGNDVWNDTICPKCGTWDCCELKFEKLEDIV